MKLGMELELGLGLDDCDCDWVTVGDWKLELETGN